MDFADGKFRVPLDRWEALREAAEGLVGARHGRVQLRKAGQPYRDGAFDAPLMGAKHAVVHPAFICFDKLGEVT